MDLKDIINEFSKDHSEEYSGEFNGEYNEKCNGGEGEKLRIKKKNNRMKWLKKNYYLERFVRANINKIYIEV
ncbi:hypothetical protein Glove_648g5 [Diversispora epigaea]|uniref:Uncharacterized protein n=1 Tax=Diversispora epigaea TaxID=1348612 RepID=A0A397GCJ0_9GLOM|nr:hypothetical protein Glove_648g5 [Diversispora epigaea]